MKKIAIRLLELFPFLEVLARKIYWSSNFFIRFKNSKKKKNPQDCLHRCTLSDFESVLTRIISPSCSSLVVHSSYGEIKSNFDSSVTPKDVLNSLLKIVGNNRTLCFPTHPHYANEIHDKSYMKNEEINEISIYDVKKTKAWTGVLPNEFLRLENVVRSLHPINSMAALGPRAAFYMEKNIDGLRPKACGDESSWKKLNDDHGLILGLGVNLVHSLTIIHVAEDTVSKKYKTDKWYRNRTFKIINDDQSYELLVSERKPKWALYYTEKRFKKDLLDNGLIKVIRLNDFVIEYIEDSQQLINFIKSQKNRYPYLLSRRINNDLSK